MSSAVIPFGVASLSLPEAIQSQLQFVSVHFTCCSSFLFLVFFVFSRFVALRSSIIFIVLFAAFKSSIGVTIAEEPREGIGNA